MKIHKKLVDKIISKRRTFLYELMCGIDGLKLSKSEPSLILNLDRIFYTLDFLADPQNNLISISKDRPSMITHNLFDNMIGDVDIDGLIFYQDKLKLAMGWGIEMQSGLVAFKDNGYKTDEQCKESRNFWLAVIIAISSPILTTILATLFRSC